MRTACARGAKAPTWTRRPHVYRGKVTGRLVGPINGLRTETPPSPICSTSRSSCWVSVHYPTEGSNLPSIRGPGVALGLVNPSPFAHAARAVLRGASRGFARLRGASRGFARLRAASRGFAALLVARAARLRRGIGDAASPLASQGPRTFSLISDF